MSQALKNLTIMMIDTKHLVRKQGM